MSRTAMKTVQSVPSPEPQASIDTNAQSRRAQAESYSEGEPLVEEDGGIPHSLVKLFMFAEAGGDICDLLDPGVVSSLGPEVVRQWRMDDGSRDAWRELAEKSLRIAAQEGDDEGPKDYPFGDASDIHYPILTTAAQQWAARAYAALVKGDKVVGVKAFTPPPLKPSPIQAAKAGPQPQNDQQAQAATQEIQAEQQADAQHDAEMRARQARAERVKMYLNYVIFYKMDNWEGETDALLHEVPVIGIGFKKCYMGVAGVCSDYVSALRLTVHNDTTSLHRCPRLTQDFDCYPHEIEDRKRAGIYRDVTLPSDGSDPDKPRLFIEQHRLDDLDGDGLAEPYIVTVDVDTQKVLRIEPAYTTDDIYINEETRKVLRIERWQPFSSFAFLPDPRGRFYALGFGRLLDAITASVDTSINQLIDAGHAEIAGGGFIASGVRLQGSGQGGAVFQQPGQYMTVASPGNDLRNAIWERTVPHPSAVTMQLLELLLAAAKDIASVKDVITGDTPATAPVGTTIALQDQALQVFSSIYKRIYRGFHDEFRLMYRCLKRWATAREKHEYEELTGGDFDEDFSGEGTDIQPIADPVVITKQQKIARIQTLLQLAESPIGGAAGMQQPQQAQAIVSEALDAMDWDRPERFMGAVQPNPEVQAKMQEVAATIELKKAQAAKTNATVPLEHARAVREMGLAAVDTHELHVKADGIKQTGSLQEPVEPQSGSGAPDAPAGPNGAPANP